MSADPKMQVFRVPTLFSFTFTRSDVLDRFLELLGGAEGDLLAGLDLDRLAGRGVATRAGGALAHLEDAETDDADALALLQVLGDPAHHVGEDALGLLLGQFLVLGDCRGKVLERDGRRASCFLRHVWPSSFVKKRLRNLRCFWP